MIQKNKEIEISDDNIFENDMFDRESTIKDLSTLLVATHEPFVLSINASWGAGKTTFVKLWKSYLENELGVHSIYFSAWEDDFSKEPLISIMGELNTYIFENFQTDESVVKKWDELKGVGGKIIKRGLPALVKGATAGVLDLDRGVESAIGAVTESVSKELIESYKDDKAITVKFKELLYQIIEEINSDKPLIIFIDELDRCRPLYAIELLERLKHIFGIEKLIFVLSIDKKQLSESIKSQYGNIDTENYLHRFIDLEYRLENKSNSLFCDDLEKKFDFKKILETKSIELNRDGWDYLEFMKYLLSVYQLSLREIEKIFIQLNILFKTIPPRYFKIHFSVSVCMLILKTYNYEQYIRLLNDELEIAYYKDKIKDKECDSEGEYCYLLQAILETIPRREFEINKIQNAIGQMGINKYICEVIESTPSHIAGNNYTLNKVIENVIKKLDFTDNFNFETVKS